MNFRETFRLSGGANSFLSGLRYCLRQQGIRFVCKPEEGFDIALLNALSDGLTIERVKVIHSFGKPIIHRKVGYAVSGSDKMREVTDGTVWGDRLQIDMSPYLVHSIFQSRYSYATFVDQGFVGDSSIILNGVDENVFNPRSRKKLFSNKEGPLRTFWDGKGIFRLAIVTWSTDPAKGFEEYLRFDAALDRTPGVEIWFIGRRPPGLYFRNIRCFPACGHSRLAALLRECHGFIQMAMFETCSNALLEAISCGLPVIYRDSGSAHELAADCGIKYFGDPAASIATLKDQYFELLNQALQKRYSINAVAGEYLKIMNRLIN